MTAPKFKRSEPALTAERLQTGSRLSVRGLAQFLHDLGKSLQEPSNGPVLGEALIQLSSTLRQHQDKELEQVLGLLAGETPFPKKRSRQRSNALEGVDLHALEANQVKDLLFDERLTKQDVIEVGTIRFGISKSRLTRQSKQAALETVTSALQNEEAYQIISTEAEREGLRRARVPKLV